MIRTIFRTGTVASSIVVAGALAGAGQQVLANGLRGSTEGGPVLAIAVRGADIRAPGRPLDRALPHRRSAARREGSLCRQSQGRQRRRALDAQGLRDRRGQRRDFDLRDGCGRQADRDARSECRARPQRPHPDAAHRAAAGKCRSAACRRFDPPYRQRRLRFGGAAGRRHRQRIRRAVGRRRRRKQGRRHQRAHDPRQGPGDAAGQGRRGRAHGAEAVRHQQSGSWSTFDWAEHQSLSRHAGTPIPATC